MEIKYIGKDTLSFTTGNTYQVIEKVGNLYRIVDEYDESYLYSIHDRNKWTFNQNYLSRIKKTDGIEQTIDNPFSNELFETPPHRYILGFQSNIVQPQNNRIYVQKDIPLDDSEYYIPNATYITGVKTFKKGKEIRRVNKLKLAFPQSKIEDWKKVRGTAKITDGTDVRMAEIHWYECKNVGKIEFKIKHKFKK